MYRIPTEKTGIPSRGDGKIVGSEKCDDGSTVNIDGCSCQKLCCYSIQTKPISYIELNENFCFHKLRLWNIIQLIL